MVNEFQTAFNEITDMRVLSQDVVLEALQSALVSAYRRDSNASAAQEVEARIDPTTGRARIFVEKEIVEEIDEYFSPDTEVTLEKARFYNPEAQVGDIVMVQVEHTTKTFGRIAAQTAKQVILQKIREAERNALYEEFIGREGDLVTGTVQSMNAQVVTLRLNDRAEAILPRSQQIPRERYRQHEKLRVYIMEVKKSTKGPQIVCSRSHRNMLRRLLEFEVPEIYNGQVEIKSIAREAGYRSKVAVAALQDGIDPVGACVGMRGIRIQNIVKELHDEKIDVIEWNQDSETFIDKALNPARVTGVYLDDDPINGRTAVVLVPDDQLSLAIGREGQNARLAAKLTGWRIDIKSVVDTVIGGLENLDFPPLDTLQKSHASLVTDVAAIITKREENKAIMPEEFNKLGRFADLIESQLQLEREGLRREEQAHVSAVRETLPSDMFEVPLVVLGLRDEISEALELYPTIGDVMLATLTDDPRLPRLLGKVDKDALTEVQTALDELMESDLDFSELAEEAVEEEAVVAEAIDEIEDDETSADDLLAEIERLMADDAETEEPETEADEVAVAEVVVENTDEAEDIEAEPVLDAFGGVIEPEPEVDTPEAEPDYESYLDLDDLDELDPSFNEESKPNKKDRRKRRRLVLDEETGEVVAKRRRKSNRRSQTDWDDLDLDL